LSKFEIAFQTTFCFSSPNTIPTSLTYHFLVFQKVLIQGKTTCFAINEFWDGPLTTSQVFIKYTNIKGYSLRFSRACALKTRSRRVLIKTLSENLSESIYSKEDDAGDCYWNVVAISEGLEHFHLTSEIGWPGTSGIITWDIFTGFR
jgi:hypothetical protein